VPPEPSFNSTARAAISMHDWLSGITSTRSPGDSSSPASCARPRCSGTTVRRHTSEAFIDFLYDILDTQPRRREIHVIVDNLSAHKTKLVQVFLDAHPRVQLHFTPTYLWLNQVELWFAKIERGLLARGIFTSISDLARKIRRCINRYSQPETDSLDLQHAGVSHQY
jgi:transposase